MAIKVSTGLRNYMLDTGGLDAGLGTGFIKIYSGTAPATADAAVTGNLLCTIYSDYPTESVGITMAASATNGAIQKNGAETWSGTVTGAGTQTAGYYRHVAAGDTGGASTTEKRIQGTIGVIGEDMNFTSTSLTNGTIQTIDYYVISLPTA